MNALIHCPACHRQVQLPREFVGRSVQCPECKLTFVATDLGLSVSADPAPPVPAPRHDERAARYDEPPHDDELNRRPRSRRGYDGDADEPFDDWGLRRPALTGDHGGVVLALGIMSVLLPCGVGLICGPIAFFLGSSDLAAIERGEMNPTNRSMIQAGRIIGICGAVWSLLNTGGTLLYFVFVFGMVLRG
jgi:hypothetical protein